MVCYMQYRWTLNPVIPNDDDISICEDNYSVKSRTTIKSAKSGVSSSPPSKTKIIEENRTLMVNSDCPIQILIDYLATEMGFDKTRGFDFCNSDGDLIGINDLQKWENAKYIMPPDKTYIIVFTATHFTIILILISF
ncbi:uncharacterized protein [Onthophagus taurus]|uniref:uncharacterized protein isoform X2 n=1 Tax=Onthophagus taurus TaxID=166361 RepID=UPI0039BE76A8